MNRETGIRPTLRDNDCDCALHLRAVCLLSVLGLDAIVLSFRACGRDAEVLSERPHICAGDNGRAGAATRITMLGCISGIEANQNIGVMESMQLRLIAKQPL